jgi:hypothetical protein
MKMPRPKPVDPNVTKLKTKLDRLMAVQRWTYLLEYCSGHTDQEIDALQLKYGMDPDEVIAGKKLIASLIEGVDEEIEQLEMHCYQGTGRPTRNEATDADEEDIVYMDGDDFDYSHLATMFEEDLHNEDQLRDEGLNYE